MQIRPYLLAETNWKTVRETTYDVAVLPWGATEAHNYHLPYGTDTIQAESIAAEAARRAWAAGAKVIVLPPVPFGVHTSQFDIPLCINLNPSTQMAVLRDVAESIERAGIKKLVILNGHGGNDFKAMIRELQPQLGVLLCAVNWFAAADPKPYFDEVGDHAGEMETSVIQHFTPHLVLPLSEAGDGHERPARIRAIREKWAWLPRPWTQVTDDTGAGNPKAATAEKGARFAEVVTENIAQFFVDLAAADPNDLFGDD